MANRVRRVVFHSGLQVSYHALKQAGDSAYFQSHYTDDDHGSKKESQQVHRILKKKDTDDKGAGSTYTGPYSIGRTYGDIFLCVPEKEAA